MGGHQLRVASLCFRLHEMESWPRRAFLFWSTCRRFILSHWAGGSLCPCRQKQVVKALLLDFPERQYLPNDYLVGRPFIAIRRRFGRRCNAGYCLLFEMRLLVRVRRSSGPSSFARSRWNILRKRSHLTFARCLNLTHGPRAPSRTH
jgi:hypothetical protein